MPPLAALRDVVGVDCTTYLCACLYTPFSHMSTCTLSSNTPEIVQARLGGYTCIYMYVHAHVHAHVHTHVYTHVSRHVHTKTREHKLQHIRDYAGTGGRRLVDELMEQPCVWVGVQTCVQPCA